MGIAGTRAETIGVIAEEMTAVTREREIAGEISVERAAGKSVSKTGGRQKI